MQNKALSTRSAVVAGSSAAIQREPLTLAQSLHPNTVSTDTPWVLPLLSEPNKTCTASCNGEDIAQSDLHLDSEAKSCVGTFKVHTQCTCSLAMCTDMYTYICAHGWNSMLVVQIFCKGNGTNDAGVFGAQCEGKITTLRSNQTLSICEGAFQSFASKGFKAPDGKFIRASRAYGCLGTSVGLRAHAESTSPNSINWDKFELNNTDDSWLSASSGELLF